MSAAEFTARHVGSNDEAAAIRRARFEGNSLISTEGQGAPPAVIPRKTLTPTTVVRSRLPES